MGQASFTRFTDSSQGVFTYLLENLGVKGVQFEELLSLEKEELQALK